MRIKWFFPAILWFIVSFILLALPGNDLPHSNLFNIPYFDKYVHFAMFFLLTFLFGFPFPHIGFEKEIVKPWWIKIAILVIVYGIAMEFVQKYFSSGRSFDLADILFDSIGSLGGMIAAMFYYGKKIGPDGNRGRNQN